MTTAKERHALDSMFNPASVALIGASASPEKMGGRRWKTLVEGGFTGPLYPINPGAAEVRGHKAYKSIRDVPGPIDLAVIAVAPDYVPGIVRDCAEFGVKNVVVITAGFGEINQSGKLVEREMVRTMQAAGGRLVGPNCSGLYSAAGKMNVGGWDVPPGPIGLVSQSGNMALDFCQMARERGIGFSRYLTIGNAADVRTGDMVDYLLWDCETEVILAYIEGFGPGEGRRLFELVRGHPNRKPIVVLKPGRSETGRSAALSHTGSLAGEDRVVAAAFRQCGIIRVGEVEEAWALALALGGVRSSLSSRAVAVLTDGGGHATLFCDTAGMFDLTTPRLGPTAEQALRSLLPPRCPVVNPIDFAGVAEGDPEVIPKALEICLADEAIGSAVMLGHFGGYHKIGGATLLPLEQAAAQQVVAVARRFGKPAIVHSVHSAYKLPALEILRSGGVPVCRAIEMPAKILHGMRRAAVERGRKHLAPARRSPKGATQAVESLLAQGVRSSRGRWLPEPEARAALASYGIAVPASRTVANPEDCTAAVVAFGGSAALKLIAPEALHKSEIGGVLLNVGVATAAAGFHTLMTRLPNAAGATHRVLVAPMIKSGIELVCGAFRDPQFGPVVMVGLGGVQVELLEDVAFRLAPLHEDTARELLSDLRIAKLFDGYRGAPPIAREALVDLLVRVSELIADREEIQEIDINPVFVDGKEAAVADVRIVLRETIALKS